MAIDIFAAKDVTTEFRNNIYRYPQDLATDGKWVMFSLIDPSSSTQAQDGAFVATPLTTIVTMMPVSAMKTGYSVNYEENEIGSTIGLALQGIQGDVGNQLSKLLTGDESVSKRVAHGVAALAGIGRGAIDSLSAEAQDVLEGILGKVGSPNAVPALLRQRVNQRLEVIFKSVNLLTHTFTLKMTARTRTEADQIQNIITVFKYGMLPGMRPGPGGTADMFFSFPYEWMIQFSPKHQEHLFAIQRSVLTDMAVDYAGAHQLAFFNDGRPVSVDISLTFKELRIITRDHLNTEERLKSPALATQGGGRKYNF
jgi:hypothetical protein